mmetsp:Transcript_77981/g.228602  ORF Transcript_77981/g.228602 Transcript_77981/m.228602 type:complete len:387 (-) Transcript_77981:41-1201(-)
MECSKLQCPIRGRLLQGSFPAQFGTSSKLPRFARFFDPILEPGVSASSSARPLLGPLEVGSWGFASPPVLVRRADLELETGLAASSSVRAMLLRREDPALERCSSAPSSVRSIMLLLREDAGLERDISASSPARSTLLRRADLRVEFLLDCLDRGTSAGRVVLWGRIGWSEGDGLRGCGDRLLRRCPPGDALLRRPSVAAAALALLPRLCVTPARVGLFERSESPAASWPLRRRPFLDDSWTAFCLRSSSKSAGYSGAGSPRSEAHAASCEARLERVCWAAWGQKPETSQVWTWCTPGSAWRLSWSLSSTTQAATSLPATASSPRKCRTSSPRVAPATQAVAPKKRPSGMPASASAHLMKEVCSSDMRQVLVSTKRTRLACAASPP